MTSRYQIQITTTGELFAVDSIADLQDIAMGAEAQGHDYEAFVVTDGHGRERRRIAV